MIRLDTTHVIEAAVTQVAAAQDQAAELERVKAERDRSTKALIDIAELVTGQKAPPCFTPEPEKLVASIKATLPAGQLRRRSDVVVAYLAHPRPVSASVRSRGLAWYEALLQWYPDRAFVAPWLGGGEAPGGSMERGIRDGLAIVSRCDELWLAGPQITRSMWDELQRARELELRVYNLTGCEMPPARPPAALLPA